MEFNFMYKIKAHNVDEFIQNIVSYGCSRPKIHHSE